MKKHLPKKLFTARLLLLLLFWAVSCMGLQAQTNVSGNQSGTWTKANSPYIINGTVTVPAGLKLTIQAGVEVRSLKYDDYFDVEGIVKAIGTAADSIRFNGFANTAYNAASSHGGILYFNSSNATDSSVLAYTVINRMGDKDYYSNDKTAVELANGKVTIRNSSIRNSELRGIYEYNNLAVNPIVSEVVFTNNPVPAYMYANSVSSFSGNTNAVITLSGTSFSNAPVTIAKAGNASYYIMEPGGQYYFSNSKVTIQPGVEIRSMSYDNTFQVADSGVLKAVGTAIDSIKFVGYANTAYDAASTHGGFIYLNSNVANDSSVLAYVVLDRMGDKDYFSNDQAALEFGNGIITVRNSSIRNSEVRGIYDYQSLAVNPIISNNTFTNNPVAAYMYANNVGGFSGNLNAVVTLRGTSFSNAPVTIAKAGTASYYIMEPGGQYYFSNSKVTIQPGVEIRSMSYDNTFQVADSGVLKAVGTVTDSIKFVGYANTAYDAASTHGGFIYLNSNVANDSSVLAYVVLDRMGDKDYFSNDQAALEFGNGIITVRNSSIRNSEVRGIYDYQSLAVNPIISNNTFTNNPVAAYIYANNVGGFSGNLNAVVTLRGTSFSNAPVTIAKAGTASYYIMEPGGQYYFSNSKVTIQPGVEIRSMSYDNTFQVADSGVLKAIGTVTDSIRFTGFANPSYAATSTHGGLIYLNPNTLTTDSSLLAYVVLDRMGDKDYFSNDQAALEIGGGKVKVTNSSIRNSEVRAIYGYGDASGLSVKKSNIFSNKYGGDFNSGKPLFYKCNIFGNTLFGINNQSGTSTDIADARTCWWGDSTGPKQTSTNPAGKGNAVSLKVLYKPFLTYPYQNNDIGIDTILTPYTNCGLTATEEVTVRIHNYGSATQTGFNVSYRINSGTVITENVGTLSIASDSAQYYTFTTRANLSAGSGTVYAFRAYSALATDSIHINDSAKITVVNNKPNLGKDSTTKLCHGAFVAISAFYNTTGYSNVLWSTPRPDSVTVAGTYTLIVTNSFGCKDSAIVTVTALPSIAFTFATANATCFGSQTGAIQINATGGTLPFKYKLDTAAQNKYQSSNFLKPLKAGAYKVNIKDSFGCVATTGSITITQPTAVSATFTKTDATCIGKADGTITIIATGGKAPYGYKLGADGIYNDSNVITGLKAGTYTVYVKDVNGCTGATATITVGQANVNCLTNSVTANGAAGKPSMSALLTPNPSNGQFSLKVLTDNKQAIQVSVLDINGRSIYNTKGLPEQLFHFGNELPTGTYLVKIRQGDAVKTVKAIKIK